MVGRGGGGWGWGGWGGVVRGWLLLPRLVLFSNLLVHAAGVDPQKPHHKLFSRMVGWLVGCKVGWLAGSPFSLALEGNQRTQPKPFAGWLADWLDG